MGVVSLFAAGAWRELHLNSLAKMVARTMDKSADESFGTSCSLLERVKANVPAAWRQLTVLYGPLVYQWSRRCGLSAEDSADVVQDVFRKLVVHIGSFRRETEGQSFRAWLWTVTRSRIQDHRKVRARQPSAIGGSDAARFFAQVPEADLANLEEPGDPDAVSGVLRRALEVIRGDFEDSTWQAFNLTVLESCTSAEAAKKLGLTSNAVRKAKARVLQRLREELGELLD